MWNLLLDTLAQWSTAITLMVLVATLFYFYVLWPYKTWSKLGVPGPKPMLMVGNALTLNEKGFSALVDWGNEYGKNVGIYMARTPILLTSDVDILKEILVKDFQNFTNRGIFDHGLLPDCFTCSVINVKDDVWRRHRHILTPAFSGSKLKKMGKFINFCCKNFVQAIEQLMEKGEPLHLKQLCGSYTLDVIAGTGFGIQTNSLLHGDTELLESVKGALDNLEVGSLSIAIAFAFPALAPVLKWLGFHGMPMKDWYCILKHVQAVMAEKKQNDIKSPDLLQSMLDVEATDIKGIPDVEAKFLTEREIVAEGITFFFGGYETTATALQFLLYLMAMNPDTQEKLYQEIVAAVGNDEPTYENVSNIRFLDSCVRETLRMYPPATLFDRVVINTRTINGVTIPAGAGVVANVVLMMKDEEHFPQPDHFIPERFEDNDVPISSFMREMVFGAGPRQCIAMRLAVYEIKMAAVSILRKFRVVKVKDTPEKIIMKPGTIFHVSLKPVWVGTEYRAAE